MPFSSRGILISNTNGAIRQTACWHRSRVIRDGALILDHEKFLFPNKSYSIPLVALGIGAYVDHAPLCDAGCQLSCPIIFKVDLHWSKYVT
ncbi:hypothetical protein AVEN_184297-1 [Araneus ventricosus]|uniref:Uncharacterized protein n=1 Tax=Araneus ventricosus TaxID=182803 RepID=A0A4Y2KAK8_ARAVE|nr:hypothetical protein AVEN_184297-1 [Araneus ventricosus]